MLRATLDDIKEATRKAQRKQKEQMEAEAEKRACVNQLNQKKDEIDNIELLAEGDKRRLVKFIDEVIKADGVIPEDNPFTDIMTVLEEEANDHYDSAQVLLSAAQSR